MAIQNFFTSRDNKLDGNTYVGQLGRLWYNPDTNSIYASDGSTVGGIPVDLATGANAVFNNLVVVGNIAVTGNISPATDTKIGGVRAGPGANIGTDGLLTIDTSGLPLSFGDFTANTNILTLVNVDQNMILATQGSAEVQLVGNIGFYKTDGFPPNTANRYFQASDDGQITILVPDTDPLSGAVKIIGTASGNFSAPLNTGVMLQVTGQNNDASRIYNDSIGSFAAFVGRRINGTVASPTAVQAGEEIIRISSTGYNGNSIPGTASARIVFQAIENYTPTAAGSNISIWAAAIGSNSITKVSTFDVANGVNAIKFTTSGTVLATGNITSGNSIIVGGNIRYDQSVNNATASGFNKTGGVVTANGRTGQLTTNADSLAKGSAGTFTINNTYITSSKDVVIVNIASGGTPNSYAISVTAINSAGSCNVTVTNNGSGALAESLVINFAVLTVS